MIGSLLVGSVTVLVHLSSEVDNDWFTSYWKCDRIGSIIDWKCYMIGSLIIGGVTVLVHFLLEV